MSVFAFVPDLMDRSRLSAAAPGVQFVAGADALAGAAPGDIVVVDLARPGALDAVRGLPPGLRVVGFGAHVDRELLEAGRTAGCTEVYARSELFRRANELLSSS